MRLILEVDALKLNKNGTDMLQVLLDSIKQQPLTNK